MCDEVFEAVEEIRKLLEEDNITAVQEKYQNFLEMTLSSIQSENESISEQKKEDENLADHIGLTLMKMQSFAEQNAQLEDQEKHLNNNVSDIQENIIKLDEKISNYYKQIQESDFIFEFSSYQKQISDFEARLPQIEKDSQKYIKDFEETKKELENLQNMLIEQEDQKNAIIKRNQNRSNEIETRLRSQQNSSLIPTTEEKTIPEKPSEPSLIIHRTADSGSELVRKLKIDMEQAILKNTQAKAALQSLNQDLDALREESMVLKSLARMNVSTPSKN